MATKATKERLSRETVTARALALVDAEGLDALTVRRLATDLGVTPMALYWHFKDKERLLDAVAEAVLAQISLPDDDASLGWEPQLRAVLGDLARVLALHPELAEVVKTRVLLNEPGLDLTERVLGLLARAGSDPEQAARRAVYSLMFVLGLVSGRPGMLHGDEDEDARDQRVRAKWASLQALSPKRYPAVVAAAGPLTDCAEVASPGSVDPWVVGGLDLLLAGIRAGTPGGRPGGR